ncbi:hypothetical protein RJ035_005479, partial [Blastomyces gilchristii]
MSSPAATHDVFAQKNHNTEECEQEEQDKDVKKEKLNAEKEKEKQKQKHFNNLAELRKNFFINYIIVLKSARKSSESFEPIFSKYKFRQWSLTELDDEIDLM